MVLALIDPPVFCFCFLFVVHVCFLFVCLRKKGTEVLFQTFKFRDGTLSQQPSVTKLWPLRLADFSALTPSPAWMTLLSLKSSATLTLKASCMISKTQCKMSKQVTSLLNNHEEFQGDAEDAESCVHSQHLGGRYRAEGIGPAQTT